jgi:hypothetical protein
MATPQREPLRRLSRAEREALQIIAKFDGKFIEGLNPWEEVLAVVHVVQRKRVTAAATLREQQHHVLEGICKLTPFEEHQLDGREPPTKPLSNRLCVPHGQQFGRQHHG